MRIAFVVYGSLDTVSGGFIYDRALVGALRGLGHELEIIGLPWRGYAEAVARQVLPRQLVKRWTSSPSRPPSSDRDGERYDVVIQDELIHPSVFRQERSSAGAPPGDLRVALVHNLRSSQPREALRDLKASIERRYFATVDAVIAVCARTLADVRGLVARELPALVARPGRDHVAPAVEPGFIEARAATPGPLRVLHAAAVASHKGLHRLLDGLARAWRRHPEFDFTLDVVGSLADRSYVRAMRRLVARSGLASRVQLHGERRGSTLAQVFRGSHVLALPSDREAYSLAALEALGFGLPVLGPKAGGLEEMFTDGEAGFLLEPDRVDDWGDALRLLDADRARLGRMGTAALGRYQAHGVWRDVAITVQDFLQSRLARLNRAPPETATARGS